MTDTEDFLEHYGIKGMKWGVRRKRGPNGLVVRKPISKKEEKARAKRAKVKQNVRTLSDQDLKTYIERLGNEKKLKQLIDEDLTPGRAAVKKIMSDSGQKVARNVVAGGLTLAVGAAARKKFGGEGPKPEAIVDVLQRGGLKKK